MNLVAVAQWDDVYKIAVGDKVGPADQGGVSNDPHQHLANRDAWMKEWIDAHAEAVAPHSGHETPTGAQDKVNTHAALTSPHSASSSATANRLALRDIFGRLEATAGASGNDLVNYGQFAASMASAGYQKLPSGLIIQWGSGTEPQTVVFPTTFPSACYQVVACIGATVGAPGNENCAAYNLTTSGFTVDIVNGGGLVNTFRWFAIGR